MSALESKRKFLLYPTAKKGPDVPYKNQRKNNPTLRGFVVVLAAMLMRWVVFLPKTVWKTSGFGMLRPIRKYIENYEPRYDPTVVPIEDPFADENTTEPVESTMTRNPSPRGPAAHYYSVADYHALYVSGELTPTAVAKAILPLIRRDTSPPGEYSIGWFDCQAEMVLAAAEASTKRYKEGRPLGLFDGVPTGVKDEYDLDGYRTCLGSFNDYTGQVAAEDGSITSWCAKKMEEAGAIILGKLSMHEFGLDTPGINLRYGTPPNPYNPRYYPGGSSSGCAYAVSAGLIPIALGSDGGGSIRIPASFCGVVGLKPTHGRLSHHPGVNHAVTCSVNGPLAGDMESLYEYYRIIGVPDPMSDFPMPPPRRLRNSSSSGRKVLGIPEAWFSRATPAVQRLCRTLLVKLTSEYGYELVPIEIPFLVEGQMAHALTMLTDAATLLPEKRKKFSPGNQILLELGSATPSTDYLLAQKLRQLLMQHLAYLWKQYPGMLIVTPTTSCAGWPIRSRSELKYGLSDGDQTLQSMEYVWLANFTGTPSVTVPAGFVGAEGSPEAGQEVDETSTGRIPVGLMATGEWCSEDLLLHWGAEAEEAGADRLARPPIWVDVVARARQEMKEQNTAP
ncbi:hypothetical protein ASPZODRAFT_133913 [Penicilliopsis zonata CBS 506.65]|uniref:Amidase domain-containing protein n=1 Tax=Penicilliopsis zonata CBS 506.65 TaxID=1073090 RepID=A0A1L9SDT3_9EURO|nr:hypothetical protein ASPZODRAFT_133913 [Penicilliopsis zonata CBS 506.65]OJJ45273.1 hypothetical protein ASPZODRAFT_133913 [Penicilliopsis zonata CBS 506.65]